MSDDDSLLNENNLSNGASRYKSVQNFFCYEISDNINFNILSESKITNNKGIDTLNYNSDKKNIINTFLTKLYNNDSTLIINNDNLKEIFSIFKQILTKSGEFSTSIVINISNFEVKYDKINEIKKKNEINNINIKSKENIDIKENKSEFDIKKGDRKYTNVKNGQKLNFFYFFSKDNIIPNVKKYYSFNESLFNRNKNILFFEKSLKKQNKSCDLINNQSILYAEKNNFKNITKINLESKDSKEKNVESSEKKDIIYNNSEYKNYDNNIFSKAINPSNSFNLTKKEKEEKTEIKVNTLRSTKSNRDGNALFSSSSQRDKLISQKIKELDEETKKFKEERDKIMKLKNEYEQLQKELFKDIEEFETKKDNFEKFKQNEIEKIKKKKIYESKNNFNTNINFNNNKLFINTKNDKEVIKLLKRQIKDLENIIKLKDDELKTYMNNKNKIRILNFNNTSKKVNNNSSSKKKFFSIRPNLEQVYSEQNIKDKKKLNTFSKKKESKNKMNSNNKLYKDIINIIKNNRNNYTINSNSSKNYFENINKNLSKLAIEKFMNISFTNRPPFENLNKLEKNPNKNINDKSKINVSFQHNYKNTKLIKTKNLYGTENKQRNNNIFFQKDKYSIKKEIPKVKLNFMPKFDEIHEITDDVCENNYIEDKELIIKNHLLYKDNDNKKTASKKKIKPMKDLNNNFYSNTFAPKNYNSNTSKNKISIIKMMKNNFNKANKLNSNADSIQKRNKNEILIQNKSSSATKNIKRIKNKVNNKEINEQNNKLNVNYIINSDRNNHNVLYKNINNKKDEYEFIIPDKYKASENYKLINTIHSEGKSIYIFTHNKKEIVFKSGVKKEIFSDGYQLVHFPNGDLKQNFPEGKSIYYFNESKTVQTSYKDGLNIFKFNNNQIEKHYPDGSKFIIFPNGTKRRISKNGNEETIYPDGKIQKSYVNFDIKNNNNQNDEDFLDSIDRMETNNENKNVFMSYLDIEQNEIDDD